MKKSFFLGLLGIIFSTMGYGQTSTETFETESHGSKSFTDNGVIFTIITHTGGFDIQGNYPGTGWSGTSNDNRYIDNSGAGNVVTNASFSIKTTSNLFKVNRFWIFLSDTSLNQTVAGTLTVTGKINGVTKFTQTKTTGFATSLGSTNGHTLIDLTNLNGQNYSNIVIDQLQITLGGAYVYAGLDAFTWVKDSGIVLATEDTQISGKLKVYPNPTHGELNIDINGKNAAQIYSSEGKLVKTTYLKDGHNRTNIDELPNGVYLIKVGTETKKIIKK
ncbi:T9SS type A sorting domain-containing protein [Kaistella faecalis]|uniref:T9SS type A sorting domain-containing protein n=1 Tax=Kaistella faecalis TaxID=2852098 RepID=UPI001C47C835|nr:T9SS type A sorting domain-containing protein [Chryseobacterium faecale]UFK98696.1 T9SS type A sorting domain-containing protein [Chryseobacterium faecale]